MAKNSQNTFMMPCNILLDKGGLQYYRVYGETNSKMLQPSHIQCVQPNCYFGVGVAQAYLKQKETNVAVVYMLEHRNRTHQDRELLLYFQHLPDPASTRECMTGRSFHWGQTLLVIFHSGPPPHVISLMAVYYYDLILMEEHFGCLQNAQLQYWCLLDQRTYHDKQLNQEGYSWTVAQGTSFIHTFHTGYLIYVDFINIAMLGSEAIHGKQLNYKGLVSYSCCVLQRREGTEYLVHGTISAEFYLKKYPLVRKLDRSGSNNSVVSTLVSLMHSSNNCSLWNLLLLVWSDSATSPRSYECFPENKCIVVVKLVVHSAGQLIDRIHKCRIQYQCMEHDTD